MSSKHEDIADSLTRDILIGQYRCGERLPSERDLAARFDANRGAVREAMKKLEQMGLASIAPGGARVLPWRQASLDVIGPLLALHEVPDPDLVDQILQVMTSLLGLAAESAVARASDDTLAEIRRRLEPLISDDLDRQAHAEARYGVMQLIMDASGNLVCQLIARALMAQVVPRMPPLEDHVSIDYPRYRELAARLDAALAQRNGGAVLDTFQAMSRLNRESARRALAVIRGDAGAATADSQGSTEVETR